MPEAHRVSKRQRAVSASLSPPSPSKSSRISEATAKEIICRLPPTCHVKPTVLANTTQLESHYAKCHSYVCMEENCGFVFPETRFLDLHQTECHDSIVAIRKERGERTFACFDYNCKSIFRTPKGRRLHLIDKHQYPSNFYFSVTNYGIGRSLSKWGEGASLLRKEWKPRGDVDRGARFEDRMESSSGSENDRLASSNAGAERVDGIAGVREKNSSSGKTSDPVDILADSMSSLSLIPPAIQFGRGGRKSGFQRTSKGNPVQAGK